MTAPRILITRHVSLINEIARSRVSWKNVCGIALVRVTDVHLPDAAQGFFTKRLDVGRISFLPFVRFI
jgi:hypothetical protein